MEAITELNKTVKIILTFIIIAVLCVAAGFYASAYFAMAGIERAANSSEAKQTESVDGVISAEDLEKLCHVDDGEELPTDYYLDGGMYPPIIYPSGGRYKMHYIYNYKVVAHDKNTLLKTVRSKSITTVELDIVDGKWVVCEVSE